VSVRSLVSDNVSEVITDRVVVCFDFAEVGANARVASSCEGESDGFKSDAADVVSVGGLSIHEALDKAERARIVCKKVGVAKLHANIDAREFRTI
jgi:hypothetical protein